MNLFQTIILSIIEGITEFLPISSTGHMILASQIMKISENDFTKSFEIIIQLGAIMAVIFIYGKSLLSRKYLWKKLVVAFLPAGIIGFGLYKIIKGYLLGNATIVLWSLLLGGIILIILEKFFKPKTGTLSQMTLKQSIIIGVFQSISIIPGVSRSAATIVGGLLVGLNRSEAVEFSFMLAIPTMISATGLDLIQSSHQFTGIQYAILATGLLGAFITAMCAIKSFLNFIKKNNFIPFGIYRIIIATIYWLIILR
jgi:undecaprenyl-diphosphatase